MNSTNFKPRFGLPGAAIAIAATLVGSKAFAVSPTVQGAWPPAAFPSDAVHYYVAPTGNDGSNGSSSSPWLTLKKASTSIVSGSKPVVVHVRPGTYKLPACSSSSGNSISMSKSGTAAAPITFISDSRWQAKLVGDPSCRNQWYITGSYINIWGFDFTGIQTSSALNSAVIAMEGANGNVDVAYNHIHDLPYGFGSAISMEPWGNSTYTGAPCSVHDNVIHDIAFNTSENFNNYGMYIACGKTSYIYNNLIYNQGTIGIHLWHAANGVNIFNNTVSSNNTASGNQSIGILVGTGDGGRQTGAVYNVSNNIVVNSYYGIVAEYGSGASISTSSVFKNNLIYNNKIDWYYNAGGQKTTLQAMGMSVTGIVNKDPRFVSPSSANYRLLSDSPAINAGSATGAPTRDLELALRALPVDIGAYEFGGVSPSPSPSPTPSPTPSPSPSPTSSPKPVLSLSASSLNFGSVLLGSSGPAQVLTLKNTGNANLSITSAFAFSSGFNGSGNCPVGIVAPGASCTVNIVFKPAAVGSVSGSMSIATNASGSPVVVKLAGVGASPAAPVLNLSASSLNFGSVTVGRTSPAQVLTLKNTGNANLSITSAFVFSSGFSGSGNCPVGTLAPGASCYVNIVFKPASKGTKTGSIQIYTNTSTSPKAVPLYGTGK
ncbi:MAG: choice-of-anchor D domain-containing protein [Bdellovibrionia bacterium]